MRLRTRILCRETLNFSEYKHELQATIGRRKSKDSYEYELVLAN